MTTDNDDNGESLNPMENEVGLASIDNLDSKIKNILFPDEQDEAQPEALSEEGEDQKQETSEENLDAQGIEQTDDQAEGLEDGEAVHSQEEEKTDADEPEVSGFQKRIDKLTALRKLAEENAENLQAELDSYKARLAEAEKSAQTVAPTLENPFSDLDSEDKIKVEYERARDLRYKCEANPDGFSFGEVYFSAEQVRDMKLNAMKAMEVQLPKQMEFIKARGHWKPLAEKTYPWYSNKESQEFKLSQQVLKNFPKFREFPDYEMFIGDYVRGYMARNAASLTKSKPAKPIQGQNVRPTSSPNQASKTDISSRKVEERYLKSQSRDDLKQIVSKYL